MKGPIKSALSVALAMATSQVFALGLGPIQIKSGLNQPLLAEIPVVTDSAAEADDLRVALASAEDFQRVGLSRARVTVPIEFAVANNGRGQTVIRLTTKDAVREPFLDFLIEASWSKGKLLREYSVLLDPPVTAPAVLATTTKAAEKPKPVEAAPHAPVSQPRAEEAKPVAQAAPPAPRPAPVAPAPAPASHAGDYTVQRGDTLSQIANEHVDDSRDYNRMLLALYKANPEAFSGNINALKTGAVLRIPSADEVHTAGSLSEAAAAVRAQNQSWQAASATVVANAGGTAAAEKPAAQAGSAKPPASERVALVPPSSSSGGDTGASHGGSGGGKDSAALRADLAHTKEALSSREQEASELKSRVSQLEDMNGKSQRLISLKDSEIAELQNKLKQLEAAKGGASASATAPATKPETSPATQAPTPAAPTPAATVAPVVSAVSTPATTPATATPAPAAAATASTASTQSTPVSAPVTPPAVASNPAPAPAEAAQKPVTTTPVKPPTAAKPSAPAAAKPWYADYIGDSPYALYGAGGILVLIAAWLLSRVFGKKKPNPRPSLGAATTDDEIGEDAHAQMEKEAEHYYGGEQAGESGHAHSAEASVGDDEMEQLRRHFDDGDTDRFVALAHSLREKLPEDSAEWGEVTELGRQMLPGSPLFAASSLAAHDGHDPDEFFFDHEAARKHEAGPETNEYDAQIKAMADHDEPLEFEPRTHVAQAGEEDEAELQFEHELDKQVHAEPAKYLDHDLDHDDETGRHASLLDEDTVGTRLDLARAYLDMGDPEGARSMLDEVLAEGNEIQKEEARKLLSELS